VAIFQFKALSSSSVILVVPARGGRGHVEVVGKKLGGAGDAFFLSGWYVGAMAPVVVEGSTYVPAIEDTMWCLRLLVGRCFLNHHFGATSIHSGNNDAARSITETSQVYLYCSISSFNMVGWVVEHCQLDDNRKICSRMIVKSRLMT
jgi:hypothetical protein